MQWYFSTHADALMQWYFTTDIETLMQRYLIFFEWQDFRNVKKNLTPLVASAAQVVDPSEFPLIY